MAKLMHICTICRHIMFYHNFQNYTDKNKVCVSCFAGLKKQYEQLENKTCTVDEYIDSKILINILSEEQ